MRRRLGWGWIAAAIALVAVIALPLTITTVNNNAAHDAELRLTALPLPEGAELLDSMSQAGKFFGNGNGMQYLGAILIRSDQTASELQSFYDAQPEAESLWVTVVPSGEFEDDLRRATGFLDEPGEAGTFIVYGWGDDPGEFFRITDLRGH